MASTIEVVGTTREDELALASISSCQPSFGADAIDYSRVIVQKPWGSEYLLFSNDILAVWILRIKAGHETSMHCHLTKKTSLIVLHGKVRCATLRNFYERRVGEGVLLHQGVFHQTSGLSTGGALVMEVETPANKQDLLRLTDKYGRVGAGYETHDHYLKRGSMQGFSSFATDTTQRQVRHLGSSTLSLLRLEANEGFAALAALAATDLVCLLRGEIIDGYGRSVMKPGDSMTAALLRQSVRLRWHKTIDILIPQATTAHSREVHKRYA